MKRRSRCTIALILPKCQGNQFR